MPSRIYDLRTLFELRKTTPLGPRPAVARAFHHAGQPGLADATGALWPVRLSRGLSLDEGSILSFTASAQNQTGETDKYEDDGYWIVVEDVLESTPSLHPWSNAALASPLPDAAELPATATHTLFLPSPTSRRLKDLQVRIDGIERTRQFFANRGFLAMETPTLVPSGGVEAYLSSFHTEYHDVRGNTWPLALPTSPEFALKKLLSEGFGKVFQLSRAYRNSGELAKWHEPEFLMLEWYRTGGNLHDMMDDTRDLVLALELAVGHTEKLPHTWKTFTVAQLFSEQCGIDLGACPDDASFREAGSRVSRSVVDSDDWDSVFCKLFMEKIEPRLASEKACFVTHYPRRMGALARVAENPDYVERFEAYLRGVEICNGYFELTDTVELDARFSKITERRPDEVRRDLVFENTMRYGLPPCSGNALGLDRVLALLAGIPNIARLMPVPFLSQFPKNTVAPE